MSESGFKRTHKAEKLFINTHKQAGYSRKVQNLASASLALFAAEQLLDQTCNVHCLQQLKLSTDSTCLILFKLITQTRASAEFFRHAITACIQ